MKPRYIFLILLSCFCFDDCTSERAIDVKADKDGSWNGNDASKEVSFTEFILESSSCQWLNLKQDEVIVINGNEELKKYLLCTDGGFPKIDFSKYSLLLSKGVTTSGMYAMKKQIQQISVNEYSLYVDIAFDMTAKPEVWYISILVPKLPQKAIVRIVRINKNQHP